MLRLERLIAFSGRLRHPHHQLNWFANTGLTSA
jgi:hypothetical protein